MGHRRASDGQARLTLLLVAALAVGVVAVVGGVLWGVRDRADSPRPPGAVVASGPAVPQGLDAPAAPVLAVRPPPGLAVLRAWDVRRARAWAAGDPRRLEGLYAAGSVTGDRDVGMLRDYTARGLVVTGLRQQVLALRQLSRGEGRLRLRVTERLAAATAVGDGVRRPLPAGQAARHVIDLRRTDGVWRVVEVRDG